MVKTFLGISLLLTSVGITGIVTAQPAAAVSLNGTNVILNPGAEAGAGASNNEERVDAENWTRAIGNFTAVQYGASGQNNNNSFPTPATATNPTPFYNQSGVLDSSVVRGNNFFAGGPGSFASGADSATSTATQLISLTAGNATQIDQGDVRYNLSGYFGGYLNQNDRASLTATFRNALGAAIPILGSTSITIGPVTNVDRGTTNPSLANDSRTGGVLSFYQRTASGTVPVGTRSINLQLTFEREISPYNNGYADNLSLTFNDPTPVPAPASTLGLLVLGILGGGSLLREKLRAFKP